MTYVIDQDDLWPRCVPYRYRLYAVVGGDRRVLAAAPTMEGIGRAIEQLHEDAKLVQRRLADEGRIGILDTMPGGVEKAVGEWIVQPYDRRPA